MPDEKDLKIAELEKTAEQLGAEIARLQKYASEQRKTNRVLLTKIEALRQVRDGLPEEVDGLDTNSAIFYWRRQLRQADQKASSLLGELRAVKAKLKELQDLEILGYVHGIPSPTSLIIEPDPDYDNTHEVRI